MELAEALKMAFVAGAVYAGIRADMRAVREKIEVMVKSIDAAHKRIDDLLLQMHGKGK